MGGKHLEMIRGNSMDNWHNKPTVKKGDIGESIVDKHLLSKGFIPYHPGSPGSHPFDRLVASRDKKTIFIADTKSKPARRYYPDTGIDVRHYNQYKYIQDKYGIDVYIYFVDEDSGTIYGNYLNTLDKPYGIKHGNKSIYYPLVDRGIRYFPLTAMEQIGNIPKNELKKLREYSTRNPAYIEEDW